MKKPISFTQTLRVICIFAFSLLFCITGYAQAISHPSHARQRIGVWKRDQIPAGYQEIKDSEFFVYTKGDVFDVACQFGTRFYSSSVDGYRTYFRVNGGAIHNYDFDNPSNNRVDGIRIDMVFERSGNANTLRIKYNVTNETNQPLTISMGSYYDCVIGMLGEEAIKRQNSSESSIQIKESPDSKYHYRLQWASMGGYEGVDKHWWGAATVQHDQPMRVLGGDYAESLTEEEMTLEKAEDVPGDYGVSWCWNDRVIEPGKTVGKYAVFLSKNTNMEFTDEDSPDLSITSFDVSHEQMEAGGELVANLEIHNSGTQVMPSGVLVEILNWYDKELLWSTYTEQKIYPNSTLRLTPTFPAPSRLGKQNLIARVNMPEDKELRFVEVDYANNQSALWPISIEKQYSSSLQVDKTRYMQGGTIRFSGHLDGYDVAFKPVEILVRNLGGGTEIFSTVSQEDGTWMYPWESYEGWTGHLQAWARYPKSSFDQAQPQVDFDILGLQSKGPFDVQGEKTGKRNLLLAGRDTIRWMLTNPGRVDLTGVKVTIAKDDGQLQTACKCPTVIKAGETVCLEANLLALKVTDGDKYQTLSLTLTTSEGLQRTYSIPYYISNPSASLVADISEINTTMLAGGSVSYQFTLTNEGGSETGDITLSLPRVEWMKSQTPQTIPSLHSGEQTTVVLSFEPGEELPINIVQQGRIAFLMASGGGLAIPYSIENVSQSTGVLRVDVRDEYTYHTEAHPHLSGATITVKHPQTGATVATTVSGEDGLANLELPAGLYLLEVSADKHESYSQQVSVAPSRTTDAIVDICLQTIHFNFEVKEIEGSDTYDIVTTVTYETMVPAPVVEMMFDKQPLESMKPGDVLIFNIALINHGLIRADSLWLKMPNSRLYQFDPLKPVPDCLDAQTSVVIPMRIMRLNGDEPIEHAPRHLSDVYCTMVVSIGWSYDCGGEKKSAHTMTLGNGVAGEGGCGDLPGDSGDYYGIGGNSGIGGSMSFASSVGSHKVGCKCVPDMGRALMDCLMTSIAQAIPVVGTIYGVMTCAHDVTKYYHTNFSDKHKDDRPKGTEVALGCAITALGFLPVPSFLSSAIDLLSCTRGLINSIASMADCKGSGSAAKAPSKFPSSLDELLVRPKWSKEGLMPFVVDYMEKQDIIFDFLAVSIKYYRELYGDDLWLVVSDADMSRLLKQIIENEAPYLPADYAQYRPSQVDDEAFARLLERFSGTNEDNLIDFDSILAYLEVAAECDKAIHSFGYNSLDEMMDEEFKAYLRHEEAQKGAVCASVQLQIHQTMALTRQAFDGTLTIFNGHESEAMKDVEMSLMVTTENGDVLTAHEMDVQVASLTGLQGEESLGSAWMLEAGESGSATLRFTPTRYAAPDGPVTLYIRGTLSYLDPFTGERAQFALAPVPITIKPTPVLDLIYFQQRDVMADNPLTEDVEPSEEVEFALLMINKGWGDATQVSMMTEQPKIVDNEKGLLLHYDMISSQLNGGEKVLALGREAPTDFGTIPGHSSAYAQWWMESSLMGHFVDYDVTYTHANANGNPALSLIDSISIHELVRSLAIEDAGGIVPAWLTNDDPDGNSRPDHLYLTDGRILPVWYSRQPTIEKAEKNVYLLTVPQGESEWQYGLVDDPTGGHGKVNSVIRLSDGKSLPTRNFWITRYTLLDGVEPVKENRFHFAAKTTAGDNTFRIEFAPMPDKYLQVAGIQGVPDSHTWAISPVRTLTVRFNKPIDPSTFTSDDIRLSHEGRDLNTQQVKITPTKDERGRDVYELYIGNLTDHDGFYVLTVQTSGITDSEGFHGEQGEMVNWMQVIDPTSITPVSSLPANSLYDLQGRKLSVGSKPHKGIYIYRGRKAVSW